MELSLRWIWLELGRLRDEDGVPVFATVLIFYKEQVSRVLQSISLKV